MTVLLVITNLQHNNGLNNIEVDFFFHTHTKKARDWLFTMEIIDLYTLRIQTPLIFLHYYSYCPAGILFQNHGNKQRLQGSS